MFSRTCKYVIKPDQQQDMTLLNFHGFKHDTSSCSTTYSAMLLNMTATINMQNIAVSTEVKGDDTGNNSILLLGEMWALPSVKILIRLWVIGLPAWPQDMAHKVHQTVHFAICRLWLQVISSTAVCQLGCHGPSQLKTVSSGAHHSAPLEFSARLQPDSLAAICRLLCSSALHYVSPAAVCQLSCHL